MKSYIKIYGPPILKAIKTLEKISIKIPEVCIMDRIIENYDVTDPSYFDDVSKRQQYFLEIPGMSTRDVTLERCGKIISRSGAPLGNYDFYFEWFTEPSIEQLNNLIEEIDEALSPLGCHYTITSKR